MNIMYTLFLLEASFIFLWEPPKEFCSTDTSHLRAKRLKNANPARNLPGGCVSSYLPRTMLILIPDLLCWSPCWKLQPVMLPISDVSQIPTCHKDGLVSHSL